MTLESGRGLMTMAHSPPKRVAAPNPVVLKRLPRNFYSRPNFYCAVSMRIGEDLWPGAGNMAVNPRARIQWDKGPEWKEEIERYPAGYGRRRI